MQCVGQGQGEAMHKIRCYKKLEALFKYPITRTTFAVRRFACVVFCFVSLKMMAQISNDK